MGEVTEELVCALQQRRGSSRLKSCFYVPKIFEFLSIFFNVISSLVVATTNKIAQSLCVAL